MIKLHDFGVFRTVDGNFHPAPQSDFELSEGKKRTITWGILEAHSQSGDMEHLSLKFDVLVSPDDNYVSVLQTARASELDVFPMPYILTNCHHSLGAVGGTIN